MKWYVMKPKPNKEFEPQKLLVFDGEVSFKA